MSNPSYTPETPVKKRSAVFRGPERPPEERSFRPTQQMMNFIDEWANGNNVKTAAARAGYTDGGSHAYQMIRNPHVIALYEEKKAKVEAAGDMSRKRFMAMLQESFDTAKMLSEPGAMVAAVREIGKACGYYAPVEKKITIEGNVQMEKLNRMSDDDLLALVAKAPTPFAALENVTSEPLDHQIPTTQPSVEEAFARTADVVNAAIQAEIDEDEDDENDDPSPLDEPA